MSVGLLIIWGEVLSVLVLGMLWDLGVAGVRGLGAAVVLGVEGDEKLGCSGKGCGDNVAVLLCVAVADVSLLARAYPESVRENLKWQR